MILGQFLQWLGIAFQTYVYTWWALENLSFLRLPRCTRSREHYIAFAFGVGIVELNVDTDTRCLQVTEGIRQLYNDHEPVTISNCGTNTWWRKGPEPWKISSLTSIARSTSIPWSGCLRPGFPGQQRGSEVCVGSLIGPLAFHSATTTLEDPCDKGDLRHLFGLMVQNLVSMTDDLRGDCIFVSSCQSFWRR